MKDFFTSINESSILLTPNRRLALSLLEKYEAFQLASAKNAWPTVTILPINTWLQELWSQHSLPQLLLNKSQAHFIWSKIINDRIKENPLLAAESLVDKIEEAYEILINWQQDYNFDPLECNDDILFFQKCASDFAVLCKQSNWLIISQVIAEIIKNPNQLLLPKELIMCGFDEFTPAQQNLFHQLEKLGCKISMIDLNQQKSEQYKLAAPNQHQEIVAMATWAKSKTQKGYSVGCIVPNLSVLQAEIEYVFNKVLADDYDISAGSPLSSFPIVADALQILDMKPSNNDLSKIERLLHSPFLLNAETEYLMRSCLATKLRTQKYSPVSIRQILALAKETEAPYACPQLAIALDQFIAITKKEFSAKKPSQWIQVFKQQLQLLGWPGQRNLNTDESLTAKRFEELFLEFSQLEIITNNLTHEQALVTLRKMTTTTIFRPKQFTEKRIKILGLLEAAGLEFDYIWLMGMSSNQWPKIQQPNPFIPIKLQRQQNMPHASANRELSYSKALMTRFCKSTKHIIFSFPQMDNSEELHESPLISDIPPLVANDFDIEPSTTNQNIFQLETIEDSSAPIIANKEQIHGGATIFKLQSICPFKAFAECRLHAKSQEEISFGLSASERGQLIHSMLEKFWQLIRNHKRLMELSPYELETCIEQAISHAMLAISKKSVKVLRTGFMSIEKQRLYSIIHEWIGVEKSRSPFRVVAQEQNIEKCFRQIPLKLRIDRIDQLDDGSFLIIDYKTGTISTHNWMGDRPEEPQLPLYCLLSDHLPIAAILFAKIKSGEMKFVGIGSISEQALGIDRDSRWPEIQAQWRQILSKIADDFINGEAQVDPKNPQTCRYCHLSNLCRIKEQNVKY